MRDSRRVKAILASASVLVIYGIRPSFGATDTWTGTVLAPATITFPNAAQWNTTDANWSNGSSNLFTAGDTAVFTDNFSGYTDIDVAASMNPIAMIFEHIAGSTPVDYIFLSNEFITSSGFAGGSSSPFNSSTATPFTLTLAPGFLGTVELQSRSTSASDIGNTIIDSGTLAIDDGGALPPFTTNNNPSITLNGGTLDINVYANANNSGNTQMSSSQLAGTMNVLSNSTLELGANVTNSSRVYDGTIALSNNAALHFTSAVTTNEMDCAATIIGNGTISLGTTNTTLRLDKTAGGDANATYDLGTGSGILRNDLASGTINLGALTGGPNTILDGSEATAGINTYAIGALASSTFQGIIRNEPTTGDTVTISKVGTSTLILTSSANTYSGGTTVSAGVLEGTATSGTPFGTGNIALNSGALSVSPSGSGSAVDVTGANIAAGSQFIYGGGGTLVLNKGTQNSVTFDVGNSAETAGTLIISRSGQGTLVIAPAGGTATSNLGAKEVFLANSTTAGNIPVVTNGIVNTSIVGQNNDANHSGDFLTYDPIKGFVLPTYGDTNFAAPSNTVTELVTTAQSALASTNVFALNAEANIGIGAGNTLTIGNDGSGAGQSLQAGLILNNDASISGSTATLSFGAAEGTIYTSAAGGTISTAITGNGGLTFFGPGTLSVSGNMSDTGTTNIQAGTVVYSGDNSGAGTASTNVGTGATLQLQANAGNTTAGINRALSLTATQLQLLNGSTLQLRADASTTFFGTAAANSVAISGGNSVTIDVNQLTSAGTNNVLTFDPAGFTAGGITINVTGGNGYSLALPTITNGTNNTVDQINPTTASVTLAGFTSTVANGGLGLGGTSSGNVVSGIISNGSGGASVSTSGTGTWTLDGANTYTGGTVLTGGVLSLNNSSALGPSGTVTLEGGTLQFTANNTDDYSSRIAIADGIAANIDTNGQNVTFGSTMVFFPAHPAETGGLTKIGAGTLSITATNTYLGLTTVNGGTLALGITGAIAATNNVANNAALLINAPITLANISGTGTTTVPASQSLTVGGFSQAGGLVNNGVTQVNGNGTVGPISGSGTLIIGTGTSNNTLALATGSGLSTQSVLNIAAGSTLDVKNNHVVINYGSGSDPITSIAALLKSGFNGGSWNGTGITSSTAAVTSGYGLGYADSVDTGNPAGLAADTLEIKYTLLGDTNLDGVVNAVDFGILAANFNKGVTGWDKGDFNYDNVVSAVDFGELAANFNKGASGAAIGLPAYDDPAILAFAAQNGLLADVPEPASVGLLVAAGVGMLSRRRRRRA
jgi:fibronectin-binding autotransporter adhesin